MFLSTAGGFYQNITKGLRFAFCPLGLSVDGLAWRFPHYSWLESTPCAIYRRKMAYRFLYVPGAIGSIGHDVNSP